MAKKPYDLAERQEKNRLLAEKAKAEQRKKTLKKAFAIGVAIGVIVAVVLLLWQPWAKDEKGGDDDNVSFTATNKDDSSQGGQVTDTSKVATQDNYDYKYDRNVKHHAEIKVKDLGIIKLELDPTYAPITVDNFLSLAADGFYDGLTFHRAKQGFMIQGGDPNHNGTGGSDNEIMGEFSANGIENPLSHKRGVISMARGGHSMDSASSQFFICDADSDFLDGQYAAFGFVTEGMDVVDAIAALDVPKGANDTIANYEDQPVIEYIKVID